ncbi:MAG: hypothetical protein ABI401_16435 [Candidatus Dormibacter sp.]
MIDPGSEISAEDALRLAFGRMLGFAVAAFLLLLGGGIAAILVAALFFRFLYS